MTKQEVARQVMEWLQMGVDLVETQTPLLVEEIIAYGFVIHWVGSVMGVLLFVAGVLAFVSSLLNTRIDPLVGIVGGFVGLVGFVVSGLNISGLIKLYTAPRLYVLVELQNLIQ